MELQGKRVLLTGATGGIGQLLAAELAKRGAQLVLLGRNADRLEAVKQKIDQPQALILVADLADTQQLEILRQKITDLGHLDIVINNAGKIYFGEFTQQSVSDITQLYQTNLLTPVLLTQMLLPQLLSQKQGLIVNIGSTLGALGFPYYATYCSSKFGLRGFSQALRRELVETGVNVLYVAPRAIRTAMNEDANIKAMHQATKTNVDEPEFVVAKIIQGIEKDKKEVTIGQPEGFFTRLNGIFPSLVDRGLKKQAQIMANFVKKT